MLSVSGKILDTLFFRQLADEQGVVVLSDDIAVEPLNHHFLFLSGMYDAIVAFKQVDVLTDAHVAIEILLALFVERTPCAQIAPTEIGRTDENFLGLFHDGIVNGNVLTFWEQTVDLLLFLLCAIDGIQ